MQANLAESSSSAMSTEVVDLTNCDREPIHIPGSIQPHGCLLACDASVATVLRFSANASEVLDAPVRAGVSIVTLLGEELVHGIRNAVSRSQPGKPALMFDRLSANGRRFDVSVHQHAGATIIEFEVAHPGVGEPLELARNMIARLINSDTIAKLTRDTARLVRATLGYDRVMVYQFASDGSGKVVSEAKRADLESFLGQHFPATDIPQQARALYLRNTIRIISDADFIRIPIEPELDASGEPLDLSFAHLRSVSPVHCEYLRNMGVAASMSISIILDGELWGMIACHHYRPRILSMAERVSAELFGNFVSLELDSLRRRDELAAVQRTRSVLDRFLKDAVREPDLDLMMRERLGDFLAILPADGVALWLDGRWSSHGHTPPEQAAASLIELAATVAERRVWATNALSSVVQDSARYADAASGVMIVPLSLRPRDFLFFFRQEVEQTVQWAGNPSKTYSHGPLGDRLTPRKSFAIWKETVSGKSVPWTEKDRQFAEAARTALVEVVLRHSELLADERAKADTRQRMLNEELNHRVKNILAVIKSLVGRAGKPGETVESYVETLRGRILALSKAHDQLARGADGGSLRDLLAAELTPYMRDGVTIDLTGPEVWLEARSFSIMALVLHELATNAAKYGALSVRGARLAVAWKTDAGGSCEIVWRESDGPIVSAPSRKGFGTMLIDRSVPYDLGGDSDVRYEPSGVVARFRLPAQFVSVRVRAAMPEADPDDAGELPDFTGTRVLVVEDQLLIAIEVEEILSNAGFDIMATVTSPREGLQFLREKRPDVAVLDLNLGAETSEAIADALADRGIPFVFSTGYGNDAIPAQHLAIPVVRKPYTAGTLLPKLNELLRQAEKS